MKNPLFIRYTLLQGLYWMAYSCSSSFAAVFLLDHTFTSSEVGLLLALSAMLSVFLQPIVAGIADKSQVFTLKRTLMLLFFLPTIPCILLSFFAMPKILTTILYVFVIMINLSTQPLLNALGMQLIQNGVPFNFGVARANGSLSYAVLTFFLGFIAVRYSTGSLTFIAFLLQVILMVLLMPIPEMQSVRVNATPSGGSIDVLKKNPAFLWLVVGLSFVFISHITINNYMIHILGNIGEGQEALGQIMSFSAVVEIPAMLLVVRILKKVECRKLLRFTMIMFLIKAVCTTLAPNLASVYAACILQAFAFAPFTPAVVYYVATILGKEDQIKGQALITIGITIGNTLGSLLGGFLIDWRGITFALMVTTVFCGIGVLCFFRGTRYKGQPVQ